MLASPFRLAAAWLALAAVAPAIAQLGQLETLPGLGLAPIPDLPAGAVAAPGPRSRTDLVTGNGFGFGVFSPRSGGITHFFPHPYRFMTPGPGSPRRDGIETRSLVSSLAWSGGASTRSGARYLGESQVIEAGGGAFFMPFGLARPALVAVRTGPGPDRLAVTFAGGRGRTRTRLEGAPLPAWQVQLAGLPESVLAVGLEPSAQAEPSGTLAGPAFALVALEAGEDPRAALAAVQAWLGSTRPAELPAREVAEVEAWRTRPSFEFASEEEKRLYRQSEVVLRMGQSREENREGRWGKGLIVASLPLNKFFIPWVRDMAYAIVALARMGHFDEARAGLDGWLAARPIGPQGAPPGQAYQISTVRYFGNGAEEADYSGARTRNVEYDSWGLALWAAGEYVAASGDTGWLAGESYRGRVLEVLRDYVVVPLVARLEPHGSGKIVGPDTSIWEQNDEDGPRRYAFSTLAALRGIRAYAELAAAAGDGAAREAAEAEATALEAGFRSAFVRDGAVLGTAEGGARNAVDGAVLAGIDLGALGDPALVDSTLARMEQLRTASGGYRRVRGETGYERQEFVFIDLSLARVLARRGDRAGAGAQLARITGLAARHHNLIPEMILSVPDRDEFTGRVGDPTGASPMVGYGAGIFVLALVDRAAAPAPAP